MSETTTNDDKETKYFVDANNDTQLDCLIEEGYRNKWLQKFTNFRIIWFNSKIDYRKTFVFCTLTIVSMILLCTIIEGKVNGKHALILV